MRSFLLVATLAFACGGEQSKPAEPGPAPAEPTVPAEPVTTSSDAGAAPEPATGVSEDCVKECVAARQMQATSIEQIELDCRAQCGKEAPALSNGE